MCNGHNLRTSGVCNKCSGFIGWFQGHLISCDFRFTVQLCTTLYIIRNTFVGVCSIPNKYLSHSGIYSFINLHKQV